MLVIGGLAFLLLCVFGSYVVSGGSIAVLAEALPFEMVTIGGAALGSFVMANSMHDVKHMLGGLRKVMKGAAYSKADYIDLLCLLFFFARLASTKGSMALEPHIEKPQESAAFQKFPKILANHQACPMICDYLRMVGMNADDPHQIEDVMGRELKKMLNEELHPAHAMQTIADALPALGIVAAVLGVVHAMGALDSSPEILGGLIGAALVGTFSGILLAYGIVQPVAIKIKSVRQKQLRLFSLVKQSLLAFMNGAMPQVAVEFGRKTIPSKERPTIDTVENETIAGPAPAPEAVKEAA